MKHVERLDLGPLGFDVGGHLLVKRALRRIAVGERIEVHGSDPHLAVNLRAWCRAQGHPVEWPDGGSGNGAGAHGERAGGAGGDVGGGNAARPVATIERGAASEGRWRGAERSGAPDPRAPGALAERAPACWGLAARGALVEEGVAPFDFRFVDRDEVWADEAAEIYAQAARSQWDPETAVDWSASVDLPVEVEEAVVQVMTYLIENETAALVIPARFAAQIHPHFREVLQVLAIQAADEARHIEIFTRRALLRGKELGLSTAGGQASLKTLLDEPDFALASFLLSVLGEGSFLSLLWFLHENAPDPVTRQVCRLAAQDEARHVAFGLAHLRRQVRFDPDLRGRLRSAIEKRHDALQRTAGLNEEVFDALVLIAAGSWRPSAIRMGHEKVLALQAEMDRGRQGRLQKLGFDPEEAALLSRLHTRNFM